jgi:uncharacterized protein
MRKYLIMIVTLVMILTLVIGCEKTAEDESLSDEPKDEVVSTPTDVNANIDETTTEESVVEEDNMTIARQYVDLLITGDYKGATESFEYSAQMKAAIGEVFYQQLMDSLIAPYGSVVDVLGSDISEDSGYEVVLVHVAFENDNLSFRIVLDQAHLISGLQIVPYAAPASEEDLGEEISFGLAEMPLSGTLILPDSENPPAIVVLVHGSGPNDRNEKIGPNHPFKDIALGLNELGIGSLRYDKRTYLYGSEIAANPLAGLYEETVEDAVLAVTYIKEQVNPSARIYILGHSLGGYAIPYINSELSKTDYMVDGYISMAGSVSSLNELIVIQTEYLSNLDGEITDEEQQQIDMITEEMNKVDHVMEVDDTELILGIAAGYWKSLENYDVVGLAQEIEAPILLLQGTRDYQVTVSEYDKWLEIYKNKTNVTSYLFDGLNHLMIYGEGPMGPDEYMVASQVDSQVIDAIQGFISETN